MEQLNAYGLKIDEDTLHNMIRYDPGVHRVSHNMALNPEKPWYDSWGSMNESTDSAPLKKRWHEYHSIYHCSVRMLNSWDKQDNSGGEFYRAVRKCEGISEERWLIVCNSTCCGTLGKELMCTSWTEE
jgi:hypothetical protein